MEITLRALRYFCAATDHGSISGAAEEMGVVPSAISAAIDQTETVFGMKLLTRYPSKGIMPTATGQLMLGKVRHLLEEYENLLAEGADLKTSLTGTLRVGYYAPIAPAFMPQIIAPLQENNTGVNLKLVECDNHTAQDGLLNGKFDVILFVAESVRPGITYEKLTEAPPYLLTSTSHRLATKPSIDLADLAEEQVVLLDLPVVGEYYRGLFERSGHLPTISATATTTEMVRSLVGAGLGCALLNMRPLNSRSYAGDGLAAIPFSLPLPGLSLVLGHSGDNQRRLVHAFVQQCRRYFDAPEADKLTVSSASESQT